MDKQTTLKKSMADIEKPVRRAKKQRGVWWIVKWSLAIFLVLVIAIVLLNFRIGPGAGSPLVRVSPQTTWATSPLKPNGDVDYIAFINQKHSVPADQNAMVDLIRIMGPKPEGSMLPPDFFQLLGMLPLPEAGDYIEYVDELLYPKIGKENITATIDGFKLDNDEIYEIALAVPFAPGQLPNVDDWMKKNERHLAALRAAVQKPKYYAPYVGETMIGVLLPHVQRMRSLARSLQASAMSHLGAGDVSGAIDDQIAMLRLGRHVGSQGVLVELLVGTAIEGIGHGSIAQTIYSGKCTAADLQRLVRELDSLPPIPMMGAQHIDSERAMGLDCVINIGRYGPLPLNGNSDLVGPGKKPGFTDGLLRSTVNWEVVCVEMNGFYDEFEAALKPADLSERAELIRGLDSSIKAAESQVRSPTNVVKSILGGRSSRGRLAARAMGSLLLPAIQQIFDAGRRITAQNATTRIAIALELYRLEHGEYPKDLAQLVPEFNAAVPLDPYTGQTPVYRPGQGDPYLLYSVGPDGVDDGGVEFGQGKMFENNDLLAVPELRTIEQWLLKNR